MALIPERRPPERPDERRWPVWPVRALVALAGALLVIGVVLSAVGTHEVGVLQTGPGYGPTTTVTVAPAPPTTAGAFTLRAANPDGDPSGPPGVGLTISGSGYQRCKNVYFLFSGVRVGAATPNRVGDVLRGGLSVPGDATPGPRTITSSCRASGDPAAQTAPFQVTDVALHRPALMTFIHEPRDVDLGARALVLSAIAAGLIVLLFAFPYHLFNSTLEENYDEVRGWFRLAPRAPDYQPSNQGLMLAVFVLATGVLYAFLSPDFGLNRSTIVLGVGASVAVLVTGMGFAVPTLMYARTRLQEWGRPNVLPGSILVAAFTVGLSRLVGFRPGYVYGLLVVFIFRKALGEEREGRLSAMTAAFVMVVCIAAWVARVPVSTAAARPHPSVASLILEAALGGIVLMGLESLVIDLIPMRFLDGVRIRAWSRAAWGALTLVAVFLLIHVLFAPGSGYVGRSNDASMTGVVVALFVGFGVLSFAFWAYFRYRPARPPAY